MYLAPVQVEHAQGQRGDPRCEQGEGCDGAADPEDGHHLAIKRQCLRASRYPAPFTLESFGVQDSRLGE